MAKREIPYYQDYVSENFLQYLQKELKSVPGIAELTQVGDLGGLENTESLKFLCELYDQVKGELNKVLEQRIVDRHFIDQRTKACYELNQSLGIDFLESRYHTILGHEDSKGRIVIGPKNSLYCRKGGGKDIAPIPKFLQGPHVTLFGPPDDAKLSVNAMNAYHRKLKGEPAIVAELLAKTSDFPKWGADDEDSKTPLRQDLISAGENLTGCFEKNLSFADPKSKKEYHLEKDHLSLPIKRFPGLALPCTFLFFRGNPLPLHMYDFALHLFKHWHNPEALTFYVPKLENEEEARYIRVMIETAEKMIQQKHSSYKLGTVRLLIVLENPRAVFRTNELIDELYPYFAGASLGWHDYLGSTARLFKEDGNYRIPVKADPNIVIKYIKASHHLLAEVVGSRGGIKIGGMYGILPMDTDLASPSFQVTMKGFIKDVITQMKRDLSGFWVAHPDFVRLGMALVQGWKQYVSGDKASLETLVTSLLDKKYHEEILGFIRGPDIEGLDMDNPLYARSLIVADIKESTYIANNHPDEVRYNVFQSLQYLTDWLSGNGCVALPAQIDGIPVRVMDDLATAERSRWEVWHELHHKRFSIEDFLRIAHEELHFIRKDLSDSKKIVQVKWDERTEKWYPVAMNLMIHLMTSQKPVEFASELLLPFTIESVRQAQDPWKAISAIDPEKYKIQSYIERFNYYFGMCGSQHFATMMAKNLILSQSEASCLIHSFDLKNILAAASFHGDIGENKKTLDTMASQEQALVFNEEATLKEELRRLGKDYLQKFGMKFLISAQGKSGKELLEALKTRMNNTQEQELNNAREALWEITRKRFNAHPINMLHEKVQAALEKHHVTGAQIAISAGFGKVQSMGFGDAIKRTTKTTWATWFEVASLSKSFASAFAIEYFRKAGVPLSTSVNAIFAKAGSDFRIKSLDKTHFEWADEVTLAHLMNHGALNMHYVDGVPLNQELPNLRQRLDGTVGVINKPGTQFQYSGGGYMVLEYLLETLEKKPIAEITNAFLKDLGLNSFSFEQKNIQGHDYAHGYTVDGNEIEGTRKIFPSFAAGAMGTAGDVCTFLNHLTKAFRDLNGSGPISHDCAIQMLFGTDKGCQKFMGVNMGLGVFTAEAGPNRLAIHQGANDGFRCLFVHCYDGPDAGLGFTILCNAELNGVLFISEVAQMIFTELKMKGIETDKFKQTFVSSEIPQEQIVNIGYRDLIFGAFTADLPEEIVVKGPRDPLADYNLAVGGKVLEVTNQRFARASNLLSEYLPVFDPGLFGRQGKIMDSWETVRHNPKPFDELVFELKKPSDIRYVGASTKYHLGNQAVSIRLDGFNTKTQSWQEILPKTDLEGHAYKALKLNTGDTQFSRIRVELYPDGGFTRLGLYNESLPEAEKTKFKPREEAPSVTFSDAIPQTIKALAPKFALTPEDIQNNWKHFKGQEVDAASVAFGGKVVRASNEHYGPAAQVISPYPPLHMFDGLESARSRKKGHSEEMVLALGKESRIERIDIDFTYFVNNNPLELSIEGLSGDKWIPLVAKTNVKAYAGNKIRFGLNTKESFSQVKVTAIPDGGMNRVKVIVKT
ncbi:serine hydrolase [Bdellovibrio sp. HCB337]|uniref:serine hydrolase n=1 Tax=Bdellovibrio sp. HCB337 TaxID=3394358 RepID=UPI0039A56BBE